MDLNLNYNQTPAYAEPTPNAEPMAMPVAEPMSMPVAEPVPVQDTYAAPIPEKNAASKVSPRKLFAIIGAALCAVAIVVGALCVSGMFYSPIINITDTTGATTVETKYSYYGGDAYTGMQHASADASNNAAAAAENVETTNQMLSSVIDGMNNSAKTTTSVTGLVLIFFGAFGACYFGTKIFE